MEQHILSVGRREPSLSSTFHALRAGCGFGSDLGWNSPGTGEVGSVLQISVVRSTQGLFPLESEATTVVVGSLCRTRMGVSGLRPSR